MAIDSRLKRQSATGVLLPWVQGRVHPDMIGLVQAERQAAGWSYSGILATAAATVYALLNFIAQNRTFNFNAENKDFNFDAENKSFNFNAK